MSATPSAPVPVIVPDLGVAASSLSISNWLVEPGDVVVAGDAIVELLIPGITCDIAAPVSGRIDRLIKAADAPVRQGEVLAWIVPDSDRSESGETLQGKVR